MTPHGSYAVRKAGPAASELRRRCESLHHGPGRTRPNRIQGCGATYCAAGEKFPSDPIESHRHGTSSRTPGQPPPNNPNVNRGGIAPHGQRREHAPFRAAPSQRACPAFPANGDIREFGLSAASFSEPETVRCPKTLSR